MFECNGLENAQSYIQTVDAGIRCVKLPANREYG